MQFSVHKLLHVFSKYYIYRECAFYALILYNNPDLFTLFGCPSLIIDSNQILFLY